MTLWSGVALCFHPAARSDAGPRMESAFDPTGKEPRSEYPFLFFRRHGFGAKLLGHQRMSWLGGNSLSKRARWTGQRHPPASQPEDLLPGLVRENLAEAVVFPSRNHRGPPTEILRKRPIVLAPLGWKSAVRDHAEMLSAALRELKTESGNAASNPLGLFAIPVSPDNVFRPVQPSFDLSSRIEALVGLGSGVLCLATAKFIG